MKNECNIVRDLLPLYIDGAASEDSRKLVEEHTAICEDCGKTRREMMLALPESRETLVEQDVLKKAAKKLRRKHMRRGMLLTLAGLALAVLMLFGIGRLRSELFFTPRVTVPLEDYRVSLSVLEDGQLIYSGSGRTDSDHSIYYWSSTLSPDPDGDALVMDISVQQPRFINHTPYQRLERWVGRDMECKNGKIYVYDRVQVSTITRTGPDGETDVLYQYGTDESRVLPASPEMEEYYRLDAEINLYRNLLDLPTDLWSGFDETLPFLAEVDHDRQAVNEHLYELTEQLFRLENLVPEWQ